MTNPYELWNTRRSLGVMRAVEPEVTYFGDWFPNQVNSTDEFIDFEKLPTNKRKLAAFALPMARGSAIYEDSQRVYRFKPAYVKVEDVIDPLMPITKRAGIDRSMIEPATLTPMQRIELIKAAMTAQHLAAIYRRWEWLASKAIIDGQVTLTGPAYPTTLVNFGRAANHTIVLGAGSRLGDAGVSTMDFIQLVMDRMNDAEFGAMPTRITMGGGVWNVLRKDAEFKAQMDLNYIGGTVVIERGLTTGANGEKVFRVGSLMVGGASGATIELWVNNETYLDENGATQRYLATNDMVFTGTANAVDGYRCFGMIVDRMAQYQALDIFPANWIQGNNPVTEWIGHTSAPLMVPINPNATLKATVVA